ncbi:hypothetical protein R5R35_002587 [Gryllus longicercus]|uniref:Capsid protein n=1 Tax=Gryllus longicercus TaxID=2509291 RepID=A0AAN9W691_9ORTH
MSRGFPTKPRGRGLSRSVREVASMPFEDQNFYSQQWFTEQPPRQGRGRASSSKSSRDQARFVALRKKKGAETQRQVREGLTDKIGVGLDGIADVLKQIEAQKTLQALTAYVTTRTLGFSAATIYYQSSFQRNAVVCNIYAFYRVNLALFECYMMKVIRKQSVPTLNQQLTYTFVPNVATRDATACVNAYPDMIGRYLSGLGQVSDGAEIIVTAFAANQTTLAGQFIPQSEHITLSNLRQTVVALADPNVPPILRNAFYGNNPIPGAIWNAEPGNRLLLNPDEIMPAGYEENALRFDINQYNAMMQWLQKKLPKFVRTSRLNPGEKGGSLSQMMTNAQETMRMPNRRIGEDLGDYYQRLMPEGNIFDFWSARTLDATQIVEGQMGLYCELPNIANFVYPTYGGRIKNYSTWHYNTDWLGTIQILYN